MGQLIKLQGCPLAPKELNALGIPIPVWQRLCVESALGFYHRTAFSEASDVDCHFEFGSCNLLQERNDDGEWLITTAKQDDQGVQTDHTTLTGESLIMTS